MHNKRNVNQPPRSSRINAAALFLSPALPLSFFLNMAYISLKQGHLSLPGAGARMLAFLAAAAGPRPRSLSPPSLPFPFICYLSLFPGLSLCPIALHVNTPSPRLTFQYAHGQEAPVEQLHHRVLWLLALPEKGQQKKETKIWGRTHHRTI